jgi:hypothetical protein
MKSLVLVLYIVFSFLFNIKPSWAQTNFSPLEAVLGSTKTIKAYKSKNKEGLIQLPITDFEFPCKVLEEEPNGMAMIQIKGEQYWVNSTFFKRNFDIPKPGCNMAGSSSSPATRGAGSGCPK